MYRQRNYIGMLPLATAVAHVLLYDAREFLSTRPNYITASYFRCRAVYLANFFRGPPHNPAPIVILSPINLFTQLDVMPGYGLSPLRLSAAPLSLSLPSFFSFSSFSVSHWMQQQQQQLASSLFSSCRVPFFFPCVSCCRPRLNGFQ